MSISTPSIIISTYNNPTWLEKVLWGYQSQTHQDFEIIIADDGSTKETEDLIESYRPLFSQKLIHVWHEDNGFQKSAILNKAIEASSSEYLIFTDGDCIPRPDFIETHLSLAEKNTFLSGGYCKLPMDISKAIGQEDIQKASIFELPWLKRQGFKNKSSLFKLSLNKAFAGVIDQFTPTKATWNGCNASTWREYIIGVNGHNERMQYGGEDREMGIRLANNGIKPKQIRNRAILLHLDHSRGYATAESIAYNMGVRKDSQKRKSTWTEEGIIKGAKS